MTPKAGRRWLAGRLHALRLDPDIRLELWDGTAVGPPASAAAATVLVGDRRALSGLLLNPEVAFGDAYAEGRISVAGDLLHVLRSAYVHAPAPSAAATVWAHARSIANTRTRARTNVHHHYDLGNDFYRLWLDEQMVYTCAYFPDPAMSLEAAQTAKLDLVCRKLALRPGERVVEAGCGWGALALHMASRYGVSVRAYNVSEPQVAFARERARALGLTGRVDFVLDDYRNIRDRADVFVSVGMLEHLGTRQYAPFGRVLDSVLDAGKGRGLLHFIGRNTAAPLSPWIERRIFPGAYTPTLAEATSGVLEPWGFSVLDVENLRLHYAKTLEHWRARFERAAPVVSARYGDAFTRAWRLYLAGSQVSFETGSMQLFQVTFARGRSNALTWCREALYRHPGSR